jgi:hypothetical protein
MDWRGHKKRGVCPQERSKERRKALCCGQHYEPPRVAPPSAVEGARILLLGDSLLDCHQGDERVERVMEAQFKKLYPNAAFQIVKAGARRDVDRPSRRLGRAGHLEPAVARGWQGLVCGNRDLRIRNGGSPADDDKHQGDMEWFDNIHPNASGTKVMADVYIKVFLGREDALVPSSKAASRPSAANQ